MRESAHRARSGGPKWSVSTYISCVRRIARLAVVLALLLATYAHAQTPGKTLIVVAHPDDEYYFAATVYRMAVQLRGTVDELVITNGEGGFHYSTLAEPFYGKSLATEDSGRRELPAIRRDETLRAGKILGIRDHVFLEQKDRAFTTDRDEGLNGIWDSAFVQQTIADLIRGQRYQYVFYNPASCHDARTSSSRHRSGRTCDSILAAEHPSCFIRLRYQSDGVCSTGGIQGRARMGIKYVFSFDRNVQFGFQDALSFQVIVSWVIAEHKSQGLLQTMHNRDAKEFVWARFDDNSEAKAATRLLFQELPPT
jgi:N-acetylglucosamine malate deacetylase 2